MGCHFCQDELFTIMAILGGVKLIPMWVRSIWAKRHTAYCHHEEKFEVGPCGYQPENLDYAPCLRMKGHEGPCAHDKIYGQE